MDKKAEVKLTVQGETGSNGPGEMELSGVKKQEDTTSSTATAPLLIGVRHQEFNPDDELDVTKVCFSTSSAFSVRF